MCELGYSLISSKLRILQKQCPHCELDSFQMLNVFSHESSGDINE